MQLFVKAMDPQPFLRDFPWLLWWRPGGICPVLWSRRRSAQARDWLRPRLSCSSRRSRPLAFWLRAANLPGRGDFHSKSARDRQALSKGQWPFPGKQVSGERTFDDEEALRRKQKAEAVDRLRDGIVHDLNNRLMVISANVDAVGAADQGSAASATKAAVGSRSVRPGGFPARTLDRVRPAAQFACAECRARRAHRVHRRPYGALALRDTVELRVSVEDDLWPVAVDPDDLDTAIVTLSAHARDTLAQGGTIRIERATRR